MEAPNVMVYLDDRVPGQRQDAVPHLYPESRDYFQIDGKTLLILCEEGEEGVRSHGKC